MAAQYLLTSGELEFLDRELVIQQDEMQLPHGTGTTHQCIPATQTTQALSQLLPPTQIQGTFLQHSRGNIDSTMTRHCQGQGASAAQHTIGRKLSSSASTPAKQVRPLPLSCTRTLIEVGQLEQQLGGCMGSEADTAAELQVCLAKQYNQAATQLLEAGQDALARSLLEKAQVLCELNSRVGPAQGSILATTLNNMACYHKRDGDLQTALTLLQQAAQIEASLRDAAVAMTEQQPAGTAQQPPPQPSNPAGSNLTTPAHQEATSARPHMKEVTDLTDSIASTHLNLSTVLSTLGRHEEAVQAVQTALKQLCSVVGLQPEVVVAWAVAPSRQRSLSQRAGACRRAYEWSGHSARSLHAGHGHDSSCRAGLPNASRERSRSAGSTAPSSCHSHEDVEAACASSCCSGEGCQIADAHHTTSNIASRLAQLPKLGARLLAMCVYNHAVEYEHLRDVPTAFRMYAAAACLAARLCGRESAYAQQFHKTLQAFKARHRQAGLQDASSGQLGPGHNRLQHSSSVDAVATAEQPQPSVGPVLKPSRHRSAQSRLHALTSAGSVPSSVDVQRMQKLQAACTPLRAAYAPAVRASSAATSCRKAGQLTSGLQRPCCPVPGITAQCPVQNGKLLHGSKQGHQVVDGSSGISGSLDARIAAQKQQLHSLFAGCHVTGKEGF